MKSKLLALVAMLFTTQAFAAGTPSTIPSTYLAKKPDFYTDFTTGLPAGWLPAIADQYGIWRKKVPAPYSAGDPGQYNAEYYDPANLVTGPSGLTIKTFKSDKFKSVGYTWASGALVSHNAYRFKGGYINFRAKVPDARYGMWGGFWFLEGGGEIDLQEFGFMKSGVDARRTMAMNLHTAGNSQKIIDTGIDLSAGFHDYGLEYIPGKSLKYFLDGNLVGQYTTNIPTGGYSIIINGQVAQNTAGWHTMPTATSPTSYDFVIRSVGVYPIGAAPPNPNPTPTPDPTPTPTPTPDCTCTPQPCTCACTK